MTATTTDTRVRASLLATFSIRDAMFALDAADVHEVIRVPSVTRIRHAPEAVAGVINLRGKIVTLLDTGLILGFGQSATGPESRIIIVDGEGEFIGMLVDRVGEVIEVETDRFDSAPANLSPAQARFFQGIYRSGGRVIALLNSAELTGEVRHG